MSAYATEWLDHLAGLDWAGAELGGDPVEIAVDSWERWVDGFIDVVDDLGAAAFLTIAGPPLDRPFPDLPRRSWLDRARRRGPSWPRRSAEEVATAGYDGRLVPTVQVFRHPDGSMSATVPAEPASGGWFPWTGVERLSLDEVGWRIGSTEALESPDLLYWFGPSAPGVDDEVDGLRPAESVTARTVGVFARVLGLATPEPVVIRRQLTP